MKIVTPIEKVILTAEECAIITKAKQILYDIYENCQGDNDLAEYISDIVEAVEQLEDNQGENYVIEAEPTNKKTITITF